MKLVPLRTFVFSVLLAILGSGPAPAQQLPARLANDPVAQALGPDVINAALKEGVVNWYGSDTTMDFLNAGRKKAFEDRFGIKIEVLGAPLRRIVDRVRTEISVNNLVCDVLAVTDTYMLEMYPQDMLEKWRPLGRELANIDPNVFPSNPEGYWWPAGISAQALAVNTDMVKAADMPKSYWDIADPKWKGKVAMRDPRSAAGGAWQMLHIYLHPDLGINYIKKLKETVNPFILTGQIDQLRDAVLLGQFPIGFNGRGEIIRDVPKRAPIAFVVPKEGLAWTPQSIAIVKGAKRMNAAKVLLTWFYDDVENLQVWSYTSRPIPHPKVKLDIPEMNPSNYPVMKAIPGEILGNPDFFFNEMETVFGKR